MIDLPMVLYVKDSVSASLPQVLPAIDFSTLFLDTTLFLTFAVCLLNVRSGSNTTPRIFGFLTIGTRSLLMKMSSWRLTSRVQSVKSVAEDLPGESSKECSLSQWLRLSRYWLMVLLSLVMSVPVASIVQSSAYEMS